MLLLVFLTMLCAIALPLVAALSVLESTVPAMVRVRTARAILTPVAFRTPQSLPRPPTA